MTATIAQLAARALRKLGVAIVADSARPAPGSAFTAAAIAERVLVNIGIPVAEADRATPGAIVSQAELAARALRAVGINPVSGVVAPLGTYITVAELASRALRSVGVNPGVLGTGTGSGGTLAIATVATAALRKLGIIASDETPSTEDQAEALARANGVHDMLVATDIAMWSSTAIPVRVADFYVVMIANLIAPQFGKPASLEAFLAAQESIRQQALAGADAQARAEELVTTVHSHIVAEGMGDWATSAIPVALADVYVAMTGALLAPVYGKPAVPEAHAAGIAQVRRVVLSGPRGQALAEAKVSEVHEGLNGSGLVAWAVSAVPGAQAEDYVAMTAVLLGPVVGYQQDAEGRKVAQGEWAAAEARVRRAAGIRGALATATARVRGVHDELNGTGLVTWTADTIPAAVADAYTAMATAQMAEEDGKPVDPAQWAGNVTRVRLVAMGGAAGQALAEQKVRAAHYSLDARGLTRWTLYDVPSFAEEPMVFKAAYLLAPECGVKADPNWSEMAEMELARCVALPSAYGPVRAEYF